jgi:two-component system sensor histidine kinase KdpD
VTVPIDPPLEAGPSIIYFCCTHHIEFGYPLAKRSLCISRPLASNPFFSNFIQHLTRCTYKDEILSHLTLELHRFLNVSVVTFWEIHDNLKPVIQYPEAKDPLLTEADANAIQWALAHQIRSGKSTENFSDARYLYLPIKIGNNSLGVVGISAPKDQLTIDDFRITQTVIDQAALAIDRLNYLKNKLNKRTYER